MITALRTRSGDIGEPWPIPAARPPVVRRRRAGFPSRISPIMADAVRRALLIGESADRRSGCARNDRAGPRLAPRVDVAQCRRVASRPAGRKLGGLAAADGCARRRGTRNAFGYKHRRPSRSRGGSGLTRSGRWVVLHGVPLTAVDNQRVAVIVEPAHPSRIAPLLMSAYGLTQQEQQLTRLILQGFSTIEIADRLVDLGAHRAGTPEERVHQDRGARPA